ncbi:MAG: M48 family metalloprotease [Prevotella sp.]|nr:M48 family metalloprotease [Prevotella sp.]
MQGVQNKTYKRFFDAVGNFCNIADAVQKRVGLAKLVKKPDYAYPCDNYLETILENKYTQQTLQSIINKYYGEQLEEITRNDSQLDPSNYPILWSNYQHCCNVLKIDFTPKVFITSQLKGINALGVELKKEAIILLSYHSVSLLSGNEQCFLLGHELGHVQFGHLIAHAVQGLLLDLNKRSEILGGIISDFIEVPLNNWYKSSEFSADRAGYLCCRDIKCIENLFAKLPFERHVTAFSQYKELMESYPSKELRLEELNYFINSGMKNG